MDPFLSSVTRGEGHTIMPVTAIIQRVFVVVVVVVFLSVLLLFLVHVVVVSCPCCCCFLVHVVVDFLSMLLCCFLVHVVVVGWLLAWALCGNLTGEERSSSPRRSNHSTSS